MSGPLSVKVTSLSWIPGVRIVGMIAVMTGMIARIVVRTKAVSVATSATVNKTVEKMMNMARVIRSLQYSQAIFALQFVRGWAILRISQAPINAWKKGRSMSGLFDAKILIWL
jgi:hypothetical protein